MARTRFVITDAYVKVSAAPAVISFDKKGKGTLFINTTDADDDTAEAFSSESNERQSQQESTVDTYIRATGVGWEVIVDEA